MLEFTKVAYICSPLSGDKEGIRKNMARAADFCRYALEYKFIPYAPHLLFTDFMDDHKPSDRETAIKMAVEMLNRADELWVFTLDDHISSGMKAEIETAEKKGMPINYFNGIVTDPDNCTYNPVRTIHPNSELNPAIEPSITHDVNKDQWVDF